MNKQVRSLFYQINNTLNRLQRYGIVNYYNCLKIEEGKTNSSILWNNHNAKHDLKAKNFNRIKYYKEIINDNAYLALLSDYSIIRCSFVFNKNMLEKESLLWWPCPFELDEYIVEKNGVINAIEICSKNDDVLEKMKMRTPMRIDFDATNNSIEHPRAHIHFQDSETRINILEPICFNKFMNFIIDSFYLNYRIKFDRNEYIKFSFKDFSDNLINQQNTYFRIL